MTDPVPPTETPASSPPSVPGVEVIKGVLRTLPDGPGVYRMLGRKGEVLYVGKAKSLKKRVVAYTRLEALPVRLQRMVMGTASMEIVTTHTEAEALLLESNLIKRLKPHYNILLKDDKSFPYLLLTSDAEWPQILKHRGSRKRDGDYYGPFASASAVNQALNTLQKAFLLRSCTDAVFSNRSRPCLLYQIKRCSAPCVDRISHEDYARLVAQARAFLSGKSTEIQQEFAARMEEAAERMAYEEAAVYRDRIRALTRIQGHQDINLANLSDADVVALHQAGGQTCVQVFFFRAGQNFGNRSYFPAHAQDQEPGAVMEAFLGQFYAAHPPPREVLLSVAIPNPELVAAALAIRAERKVALSVPQRGERRKAVEHALTNAREALGRRMAESSAQQKLLQGVADLFGLDAPPQRIEVYDNSHISGTDMVGGMIVAGPDGFEKGQYRRFNVKGDRAAGDDYGMMREVLTRRFSRAMKEDPDRDKGQWPDLVVIDGGKGQLKIALEVFADLGIEDLALVSIAKGPDRNAGRETFHMEDRAPFDLPVNDPVLYFLQRLRDEAHRYAIGSHRAKRSRNISKSPLDTIPGVGGARKKALLRHFGSAREVSEAGLADLEAVDGVSKALAQKIYDHFHNSP